MVFQTIISIVVKRNLINGHKMTCPRCKKEHDILQYKRLEEIEEFSLETTAVYKCPVCRWLFAPAGEMPHEIYENLKGKIEELLKKL
jgi:hypothetical protein